MKSPPGFLDVATRRGRRRKHKREPRTRHPRRTASVRVSQPAHADTKREDAGLRGEDASLSRRRYIVVFAETLPLSLTCVVRRPVCRCGLAANCRVAVERHHYIGAARHPAWRRLRLVFCARPDEEAAVCRPCGCCYAVSRRRSFFSACATNVSLYSAVLRLVS